MQKKIYIGGLPWELDRIGLLNYFKAVLENNGITASYKLQFSNPPLENPNATLSVVDVFVALDKENKNKSRGFGFVTLEIESDDAEELFNRIIELFNKRVLIGIRGARELIVKEADPREEGANNNRENRSDSRSRTNSRNSNNDDAMGISW